MSASKVVGTILLDVLLGTSVSLAFSSKDDIVPLSVAKPLVDYVCKKCQASQESPIPFLVFVTDLKHDDHCQIFLNVNPSMAAVWGDAVRDFWAPFMIWS